MIANKDDGHSRVLFGISLLVTIAILGGCDSKLDDSFTFSVMSYNVGDVNNPQPTKEQVADLIHKYGVPDVLFIQDTPWALKFKDLAALTGLPYFVTGRSFVPHNSLGILTRFPLRNADVLRFQGTTQRPAALCAAATLADHEALLCSLHLQSPSDKVRRAEETDARKLTKFYRIMREELFSETLRSRSVDSFLAWLDTKPVDIVVVGGDFNSFQLSKPIRTMATRFKDAFWPSWDYFQSTYTDLSFPIKPRLDYIFHSGRLKSVDTEIIRDTIGDHYPIRATLSLSDGS